MESLTSSVLRTWKTAIGKVVTKTRGRQNSLGKGAMFLSKNKRVGSPACQPIGKIKPPPRTARFHFSSLGFLLQVFVGLPHDKHQADTSNHHTR
jgi:hypothetical protein